MIPGIGCRGWGVGKDLVFCLISALLLILSFPNYNLEFLAWFGFLPLFFVLNNKSPLKAFFLAYLTGIIFWTGTIYWLVHVTLAGLIILVLYLAIYFGIFGLSISYYTQHPKPYTPFCIASTWVLLEYLRSNLFTGFPWNLLGYSQYLNLPVIQIADITGVWGISFLVMLVNVCIYSVMGTPEGDTRLSDKAGCYRLRILGELKKYVLPAFFLIVTLLYGQYRLYINSFPDNLKPKTQNQNLLKVSVIQGNIPQEEKWDRLSADSIVGKYINLSSKAILDGPDLIIWPEAAFPYVLREESDYSVLTRLLKEFNRPFLAGVVRMEYSRYYNSALLFAEDGRILNKYDKIHLVPFGEYVPLRGILGFLETVVPIGDFAAGKEYTLFEARSKKSGGVARAGVLICFEDVFPALSRRFVQKGADFLVNITNDAWFRKTAAPYQHLSASVFRAVENRVYLVRAANTGVSGFIAPSGRIISLVQDKDGNNIFINGIRTDIIETGKNALSLYCRIGDVFVLLCGVILVLTMLMKVKES